MSYIFFSNKRMSLSLYLVSKFLEQTMTDAPFLIASFINFSPLNLFPLMAKKI